jgi:hypothetical protein
VGSAPYLVLAVAAVEARVGGAVVDVGLAVLADEALAALALEPVVQVEALGRAGRVAKVGGTLVDGRLAVESGEAWPAVANVAEIAVCGGQVDNWFNRRSISNVLQNALFIPRWTNVCKCMIL